MQKQPFPVGGGVKSLSTWGSVKYFRTRGGGGLPIWEGLLFLGGQYPITCHGNILAPQV